MTIWRYQREFHAINMKTTSGNPLWKTRVPVHHSAAVDKPAISYQTQKRRNAEVFSWKWNWFFLKSAWWEENQQCLNFSPTSKNAVLLVVCFVWNEISTLKYIQYSRIWDERSARPVCHTRRFRFRFCKAFVPKHPHQKRPRPSPPWNPWAVSSSLTQNILSC